jgi:hypothetical protein
LVAYTTATAIAAILQATSDVHHLSLSQTPF